MITRKLIEAGVCFAVVQSNSFLTRHKICMNQEFEIIASSKDYNILKKFGFVKLNNNITRVNDQNPEGIISRLLEKDEITEVRSMFKDYFDKVVDNSDGMVWEMKDRSFKQYLKAS